VQTYIEEVAGDEARPKVVAAVHRTTEGNPLFMDGLVRLLVAEGRLHDAAEPLAMPEGVRDAIARRLARISDPAGEVLRLASVLGRDFDVDVLAAMAAVERDELFEILDEPARAGIIERALRIFGRYSFSHVLIRDALYDVMLPAARTRAHLAAADAIEAAYASDMAPHIAEIAAHCVAAGHQGAARAVAYAERAGKTSLETLAYEDAASWFERALERLDLVEPDATRRAELTLSLADAIGRSGDLPRARASVERAVDIARSAGDPTLQARATLMIGEIELGGLWVRPWRPDPQWIALLEDALSVIGSEESTIRARLLCQLSAALYFTDQQPRGARLAREAVTVAERLDDDETLGYCLAALHIAAWSPENLEERTEIACRVVELAERTRNRELLMQSLIWNVTNLLEHGDVAGARALADRYTAMAEELHRPHYRVYSLMVQGTFAMMEARFDDVERMNKEARALAEQIGDEGALSSSYVPYGNLLREWGRAAEIRDPVRFWTQRYGVDSQWMPFATWLEYFSGTTSLGRQMIEQGIKTALLRKDSFTLSTASLMAEVGFYMNEPHRAAELFEILEPNLDRYLIGGRNAIAPNGPAARFGAMAASLLRRLDEADELFSRALALARAVGDRVHEPRIMYEHARAIMQKDPERARRMLDVAKTGATRLGMTALLSEIAALEEPSSSDPRFVRDDDRWMITFGEERAQLPDRIGLRYLSRLIANPKHEFHVIELLAGGEGTQKPAELEVGSTAGFDAIDPQAKREYQTRVAVLEEELEEAKSFGDAERALRAEQELAAIVEALRVATGLGGRSRKIGSDAERARVSVTKAIKAAIDKIGERAPRLGAHLESAIRTGSYCSYQSERAVTPR
ncbi:MAG: hypothetical protein ABR552_08675, partial [Actinomycetota bacterium]